MPNGTLQGPVAVRLAADDEPATLERDAQRTAAPNRPLRLAGLSVAESIRVGNHLDESRGLLE